MNPAGSTRKQALIAAIGVWIMRAIILTLRVRVVDRAGIVGKPEPRLIWAFWHNRLFLVPHIFHRHIGARKGAALTSASKDGEIVAQFLTRFNVRPVRGSSSRRGAAALLEMRGLMQEGWDLGLTPDGPRGPKYRLNPGIILLAQKTGAQVVPLTVDYSRYFRLKSWDEFIIPMPFARADVTIGELHTVRATTTEEEFEAERARLEKVLLGYIGVN